MKKLLILLLLPLIALSSVSYGGEINSLFGIDLYDNAENYIDSNKYKNRETIDGYFNLTITEKIKIRSPYISFYSLTIDSNNIVHKVYGSEDYKNLEICLTIQKDLLSKLEKKYQIVSLYNETPYPEFIRYGNFFYTSSNNYFSLQCRENYADSEVILQLSITTDPLGDAVDKFWDSGL